MQIAFDAPKKFVPVTIRIDCGDDFDTFRRMLTLVVHSEVASSFDKEEASNMLEFLNR